MLALAEAAAARGEQPFRFRVLKAKKALAASPPPAARTFGEVAELVAQEFVKLRNEKIARLGIRKAGHNEHQHGLRIRNTLVPFFGPTSIAAIDKTTYRDFVANYHAIVRGKRNPDDSLSRSGSVAGLAEAEGHAITLDAPELQRQLRWIEAPVKTDPALAIGTAKELVESVFKTVLVERHIAFSRADDLPILLKRTQGAGAGAR